MRKEEWKIHQVLIDWRCVTNKFQDNLFNHTDCDGKYIYNESKKILACILGEGWSL